MTKKTTFSNLSSNSARKKRSLNALRISRKKDVKKDHNKERAERLKEWRKWWT
tara:strand:- start:973 stop:1131 length:159 start_codon:yes stop_codon:yes gene_type:complete